jgi:ribosomal protein S18 acetylase RimI-like enzyme
MMLVQQMSQPPSGPPPEPISDNVHPTVNADAPPSILQLGKSQWAASQLRSPPSPSPPTSPSATPRRQKRSPSQQPTTSPSHNRTATPPPTTAPFTLRPATPTDAPAIRSLGATVFRDTFGFSIPPSDLATYLSTSYSLASITSELSTPASHTFIVAHAPSQPKQILGFAQLTERTTEPCLAHLPQSGLCELQRLYVAADAHGRGVGKALTRAVENVAREKGYRYMWLGVWEGNFVAQGVYEKAGFARVGDHEFTMGRCVQIDWIMVKEL